MESTPHSTFAEQFLLHQRQVYRYIVTLVPNRADADEIFQQTSLVLWQKWSEFDPARGFVPWANTIAHNLTRNYLRKADRTRVIYSDEILDLLGKAQQEREPLAEARLVALRACLKRLPETNARLVQVYYAGEDSMQQFARRFGMSPSAFYMRLHRIRRALLDCIQRRLIREEAT